MGNTIVDVIRVGVVSPVAGMVVHALSTAGLGDRIHAERVPADASLRVGQLAGQARAGDLRGDRLLIDVALISAFWPVEADGPFDVLDALDSLAARSRAPVVMFGHGVGDREFVNEALGHPQVVGLVPSDIITDDLAEVLIAAATDGSHPVMATLVASRPSLAEELADSPLMAGVACAVTVHGATSWADIATLTGFSVRTIQTAPRKFAALVRADLGLDRTHDVTQPLLYHWLGTKVTYLQSWCRRHPEACQPTRGR